MGCHSIERAIITSFAYISYPIACYLILQIINVRLLAYCYVMRGETLFYAILEEGKRNPGSRVSSYADTLKKAYLYVGEHHLFRTLEMAEELGLSIAITGPPSPSIDPMLPADICLVAELEKNYLN